jgi:hypothetical protein
MGQPPAFIPCGLSCRPELLIPEGDEKRNGGDLLFSRMDNNESGNKNRSHQSFLQIEEIDRRHRCQHSSNL